MELGHQLGLLLICCGTCRATEDIFGSISSNGLVDVSKWRYLSMLRPAENFWRILPIQKVTTCHITTSRNIQIPEHQWNYGADWKVNWSLPNLELGVSNNSKFNHKSTEKSLSNFAMSQLLEVYEYFPPKNYNGWFTWKSPSKWKGNSSDPNLHFFLGKKALSFSWSFHGMETYPSRNNRIFPAFQRSQERKPWKNAKEPREKFGLKEEVDFFWCLGSVPFSIVQVDEGKAEWNWSFINFHKVTIKTITPNLPKK